ncbi:hypothetical protein HQ545_05190 [Candidatus Woesearchaeota archaeon]|nr:hypothetical protein [Candidatus Woesearchaeota archaeon]
MLEQYKKGLAEVKDKVDIASKQDINIKKVVSNGSYIYDYKFNKAKYLADRIKKSISNLVTEIKKAHSKGRKTRFEDTLSRIMTNTNSLLDSYLEPEKMLPMIEQVEQDLIELEKIESIEKEITDFEKEAAATPLPKPDKESTRINFDLPDLPEEIAENIKADIDELRNCFNAGCYRSSIILCGRVIETALHRKYFEVTGKDALEKEPGIGLGKLIARMSEKKVVLDPGLPQQIHFVNQVRICSVHTKQHVFNPSKNQAQATILYTLDILSKLFLNTN